MGKIVAPETRQKGKYVNFDEEDKAKPDSVAHQKALKRSELRKTFVSVDSQFAESNHLFRNYKYTNANTIFPHSVDADKRFVSKCYPYAKGGLLLVDEPKNDKERVVMLEKHKVLRKLGFRHVVLEDWVENEDGTKRATDIYDLAKQLGET